MENLKEYRELVFELLAGRAEQIPLGNGTISNLIERLEIFKDILSKLDIDLANLGNKYVANNHSTAEQIIEIKKINKETIVEFANNLGLSG